MPGNAAAAAAALSAASDDDQVEGGAEAGGDGAAGLGFCALYDDCGVELVLRAHRSGCPVAAAAAAGQPHIRAIKEWAGPVHVHVRGGRDASRCGELGGLDEQYRQLWDHVATGVGGTVGQPGALSALSALSAPPTGVFLVGKVRGDSSIPPRGSLPLAPGPSLAPVACLPHPMTHPMTHPSPACLTRVSAFVGHFPLPAAAV